MGEVYRATDSKLGRDVALKILPPASAANPERRQRFEREAKAIASLQHPHIVTIHSIEEADGIHFLTMELVRGKTLSDLIPTDGLPLERLFEIGAPLADAVHAAHERGVIHRARRASVSPPTATRGEESASEASWTRLTSGDTRRRPSTSGPKSFARASMRFAAKTEAEEAQEAAGQR